MLSNNDLLNLLKLVLALLCFELRAGYLYSSKRGLEKSEGGIHLLVPLPRTYLEISAFLLCAPEEERESKVFPKAPYKNSNPRGLLTITTKKGVLLGTALAPCSANRMLHIPRFDLKLLITLKNRR